MTSRDLKQLTRSRGSIKAQFTRIKPTIDSIDSTNHADLAFYKEKLESIGSSFSAVQSEIEMLDESDDQFTERGNFDEELETYQLKINRYIRQLTDEQNRSERQGTPESCGTTTCRGTASILPKIELKPFDGNPDEWTSFKDTFQSLVHDNAELPAVQKFHVLKNSLRGSVSALLANLTASAENYEVAWGILKKRCEVPRLIIQSHLKALFELPELNRDSPSALRSFSEVAEVRVSALKALGQPVDQWDAILVYLLTQKLDKTTKRAWERTLEREDLPRLATLLAFLEKQSRGESESATHDRSANHDRTANPPNMYRAPKDKGRARSQNYAVTQKPSHCPACGKGHAVLTCKTFLDLQPKERFQVMRAANRCVNCFRLGHIRGQCRDPPCRRCHRRHHTLLHLDREQNNTSPNDLAGPASRPTDTGIPTSVSALARSEVLLGTAQVLVRDSQGNDHRCRVLLDSGSQSNFMTEDFARQLKLPQNPTLHHLSGLGAVDSVATTSVAAAIRAPSGYTADVEFFVLPRVTSDIPAVQIDRQGLDIPRTLRLADPEFHKPARIDALLGNSMFYRLLSVGQIRLKEKPLLLQKTLLGWIVTGETGTGPVRQSQSHVARVTLEEQLVKFWEMEEVRDSPPFKSAEEEACEAHFTETTVRNEDGRYTVRLPFNKRVASLGSSFRSAVRRFNALERRLNRKPHVKAEYAEFLNEYERLGHMTDITAVHDPAKGYYIPHLPVFKEESITTKLRVVFNASAKTTTGISLNDTLMVGPTIQQELFAIVVRFRTHRYALTADIEKMYRQIRVHPDDAIFQKIIWRDESDKPLRVFRLDTVTYGTASAPFQAIRCLHRLAHDEESAYPHAAAIFRRDFYVDDLLTGAESRAAAARLRKELCKLAETGGLNLRKWSSNEPDLVDDSKLSGPERAIDLTHEDRKTLGIMWEPRHDRFKYVVRKSEPCSPVSKRSILSAIAKVFDPLGLVAPVTICGKLLMQQLWLAKLSWDESVPQSVHNQWQTFQAELAALEAIRIPRRILVTTPVRTEVHGFCDASERAYGACLYLRSLDGAGKCQTSLIAAKTRVAPLKTISLPRLELCAAQLLSKIYVATIPILALRIDGQYFWSDSMVTLQWLQRSPHALKTFIANRVAEVQDKTGIADWRHVASSDNPADLLSRGTGASELAANALWWNGPAWLSDDSSTWPHTKIPVREDVPEQRRVIGLVACEDPSPILTRFSSLAKLVRVVATCLRWAARSSARRKGGLTAEELRNARTRIIRLTQAETFPTELRDLTAGKTVEASSKLLPLQPFIDSEGLIRVGGRLKHAELPFEQRHPLLLPRSHHVVDLIIRHEHLRHYHAGAQATLSAVRQAYWPISGRGSVRQVIRRCTQCFRVKPISQDHIMGNLPKTRVVGTRPFLNTGIDYCGPFLIKERKVRNRARIKVYVAVFICFATKAIHLELVSDLTAEACIAAIKRFFARRGKSANLYSDNGTNFVGANKEIREMYQLIASQQHTDHVKKALADEQVTWHFIPARSPHFGGLWESAVKSFKRHLYRTLKDTLFTFEQLNTHLTQIEAVLNSRPLIPLSSDPNDLSALTPGHFIIGDNLTSLPEPSVADTPINRLSVWQHMQRLREHFWSRWHREYLQELHTRSKWHKGDTTHIHPGTMVVIREDNTPPMHWKLGRISRCYPGDDGVIRVADVRTSTGTYKRALRNLCPLPITDNDA